MNGKSKWKCFIFTAIVFILACSTSHSTIKKNKDTTKNNVKQQQTFDEKDYSGDSSTKINDFRISEEIISEVFRNTLIMILSTGKNTCVVVEENGSESSIGAYELKNRQTNPPELGGVIVEYALPASVKFTTAKRYFYYNQARKVDFDEEDIRLRLLDENPVADLVVVKRNGVSAQKLLVDVIKNSSQIQMHQVEE